MMNSIPTQCAKCGTEIRVLIADGCDPEIVAQLLRMAKCNRCKPYPAGVTISPIIKPEYQTRLPHAD